MNMKLWKISRIGDTSWDEYDSAVVAAETEAEARAMCPTTPGWPLVLADGTGRFLNQWGRRLDRAWVSNVDEVSVEYLGEASPGQERAVIVSSFNAG